MRKQREGSALLLTIFFLIVLAFFAFAFLRLLPVELNAALTEKMDIQAGYAADAGIINFATSLKGGTVLPVGTTGTVGDWTWEVVGVETLATNIYRVTTEGSIFGRPHRRVVAVLEFRDTFNLLEYAFFGDGFGDMNNKNAFWPANVPINGDIFFNGIWSMDTSSMDLDTADPADAPVQGDVFFTEQATGSTGAVQMGVKGEQYTGGEYPASGDPPTENSGDYAKIYRDGSDSLVNFAMPDPNVSPGDPLITGARVHREVVSDVLAVTGDDATIDAAETSHYNMAVAGTRDKVYIPTDGSGNTTGGLYIANDVRSMVWGQDGSGNSTVTMQVKKNFSGNPNANDSYVVTYTDTQISIKKNGTTIATHTIGDADAAEVVYVRGNLDSIESDSNGYKGQHTVAVDGNVVITGEILKDQSSFPRPSTPPGSVPAEDADADILGIISGATLTPGGNYGTMTIDIDDVTSDNNYYLYAACMGLNKKMFSQATGSSIPSNGQLILMGQVVMGASNQGQTNTATDFYADTFLGLWLDPNIFLLPYWPTIGSTTGEVTMHSYMEGPAETL